MEWWQIFLTVASIMAALITVLRFIVIPPWPESRIKRFEERYNRDKFKTWLEHSISQAKCYEYVPTNELAKLQDAYRPMPKTLRRKIGQLTPLVEEYTRWRKESQRIVNRELGLASKDYEELHEFLTRFGDMSDYINIDQMICEGYDKVILGHTAGGEKEVNLKQVVEDSDKFVGGLKKLEDRQPVKMLTDARAKLLDQAQKILKEL